MNANVHLRVVVSVQLSEDDLKVYCPKFHGGLKALWSKDCVK